MNWLKDKFESSSEQKGIWLASGSPIAAELVRYSGFDWALIDMEHGLGSELDTLNAIKALSDSSVSVIVRIPTASDKGLVKKMMDYGASGIMAPAVGSELEALSFVQSMKYPPEGLRGMTASSRASSYGFEFKKYFAEANKKSTAIVQIETVEGLESVRSIAALPGVDVLFVGHSDLSLELGCFENFSAPCFVEAEEKILNAAKEFGKKSGMLLKSSMKIDEYRKKGFSFFALGTDVGCLKSAYASLLKENK